MWRRQLGAGDGGRDLGVAGDWPARAEGLRAAPGRAEGVGLGTPKRGLGSGLLPSTIVITLPKDSRFREQPALGWARGQSYGPPGPAGVGHVGPAGEGLWLP